MFSYFVGQILQQRAQKQLHPQMLCQLFVSATNYSHIGTVALYVTIQRKRKVST